MFGQSRQQFLCAGGVFIAQRGDGQQNPSIRLKESPALGDDIQVFDAALLIGLRPIQSKEQTHWRGFQTEQIIFDADCEIRIAEPGILSRELFCNRTALFHIRKRGDVALFDQRKIIRAQTEPHFGGELRILIARIAGQRAIRQFLRAR